MNLSTRPRSSTKPEQERPRGPRLTPCSAAKGQACPPRPGATREHRLSRWLLHTRRRPSQSSCVRKRRSRWERRRGRPYLLMAWSCRWKSHITLATRAERRIQQGGGEQNQGTNITLPLYTSRNQRKRKLRNQLHSPACPKEQNTRNEFNRRD